VLGFRETAISGVCCRPEESAPDRLYAIIDEYLEYSKWCQGMDLVPHIAQPPAAVITAEPIARWDIPQLICAEPRKALALAARYFFGTPDRSLRVVGVTGTKGKTTTACLIAQWLTALGEPCASLGTLGLGLPDGVTLSAGYTTPLSPDLYRFQRVACDAGARALAMEVSSHGIALDRAYGLDIAVRVLTNVGRDHLDFHGTEAAYRSTKRQFFADGQSIAVVNCDDSIGAEIAKVRPGRILTYGTSDGANLRIANLTRARGGMSLEMRYLGQSFAFECPLIGRFNALNVAAAMAVGLAFGFSPERLVSVAGHLNSIPGRMEFVPLPDDRMGVVDFAHTAESLREVLETLREGATGRVITVFGCGGDRDTGKRPLMGAVAAKFSDVCVVTSDNPRSEPPMQIINQILAGMPREGVHVEVDRHLAQVCHPPQRFV
jgi:UDP-N-acetylmuramoyl-L-alanyl-D-glutamate--2,6-diaminopimelate ligase